MWCLGNPLGTVTLTDAHINTIAAMAFSNTQAIKTSVNGRI
jgi:hypothetical protein